MLDRYHEGFGDGYAHALHEIFLKISEVEGLDAYTIDIISDMIEYDENF